MKETSNLSFPNMGYLQALCHDMQLRKPEEEITAIEWERISKMIRAQMELEMKVDTAKTASLESFPWAVRMCADIAPEVRPGAPKWQVYANWLDLGEGVCLLVPLVIANIVRSSLSV